MEIILGLIPEAIYFSLFMIFAKKLTTKKYLFILLNVILYLILKYFLHYTVWFKVLYISGMYGILKLLYRKKAQVTDIFTFMISSFILFFISGTAYLIIWLTVKQLIISILLSRLLMILFFVLFGTKLYKIQNVYKVMWNRNDSVKKKIKSITFRCINVLALNLMIILSGYVIIFILCMNGGV